MAIDNKRTFKRSTKKKGRKFIQISATPGRLYALDMAGNVWEFSPTYRKWMKLHDERSWEKASFTL